MVMGRLAMQDKKKKSHHGKKPVTSDEHLPSE